VYLSNPDWLLPISALDSLPLSALYSVVHEEGQVPKTSTINDGFPLRLRKLRKGRGLTQGDLAKLVGLHQNHIGRYERGECQPTADALRRLVKVLEVSVDYLVQGTEQARAAPLKVEDRQLAEQFEEVGKLSERDQAVVKELLDAFLTRKKIQALVGNG
jgi:transcriptional regulator with XRE-family HTH domain